MSTNSHITHASRFIPANKLERSHLNARRTVVAMGMEELKASLLAHGLMQNLVVTDAGDGRFLVIAGGRRLEAIRILQAEGKLPDDYEVPCQIVADDQAVEMSLAENIVRLAMHPADQFEAFAKLIDQGNTAAEVAVRFGIEESLVLKRLRLARVAPELIEQYRQEGMTLECLMAFAVIDDHQRQMKVYESLNHWQKDDPYEIRAALTDKMVESRSKLARFVGLPAYEAAGGLIRWDLFGDEVYLESPKLLKNLAEQQLEGIRRELEAEGWAWIEINPDRDGDFVHRCGRLKPHLLNAPDALIARKSELDDKLAAIESATQDDDQWEPDEEYKSLQEQITGIEEQLASYVGYDATQKQLAGCCVSIGHDGTPFIDKGLVKPEHRKALARLIGDDGTHPAKVKPKDALPEKLRTNLAASRNEIAQLALASHPQIAQDLLIFTMASRLFSDRPITDGPRIEFRKSREKLVMQDEPSSASKSLSVLASRLDLAWLKHPHATNRFGAFRGLADESKLSILAYCMASCLEPKLAPVTGDHATAYDLALSLTNFKAESYWRPTQANFLSRINREQLLALALRTHGEAWVQSRVNEKKSVIAEQMERAFADPTRYGTTDERRAVLHEWLPEGLSLTTVAKPQEGKTKKGRKAA